MIVLRLNKLKKDDGCSTVTDRISAFSRQMSQSTMYPSLEQSIQLITSLQLNSSNVFVRIITPLCNILCAHSLNI